MGEKMNFAANGVSEKRYEGEFGDSFDKRRQLKVLLDDLDNVHWTRAHFCLYCLTYPESNPWGKAMRKASALYNKGEHGLCLEFLRGMTEDLQNGLFEEKETTETE